MLQSYMLTSKNYYTNDALNAGKGQENSMSIVKETNTFDIKCCF